MGEQKLKTRFRISLLSFLLAASLCIPLTLNAADEDVSVRLLVELRSPTSLQELRGARVVGGISQRVPKEYFTAGQKVRAADLRRWRVVEVGASEVEDGMWKIEIRSKQKILHKN